MDVYINDLIKEIEEKKQEDKPKYNTIEKPRKTIIKRIGYESKTLSYFNILSMSNIQIS